MASLPDLFENLKEYSASDLYDIIIKSYYYPAFYILHAIYVCFNLRFTARKTGFPWYRSFGLGFMMTAGPRYMFAKLSDRLLIEFEGNNGALIAFSIVWACFNICPFDLVFKFAMRPASKLIIQCLDAFSQAQNILQLCYSGVMIFEGKALRVMTMNVFCICTPLIVDVLDRLLIGQRNWPMAYQFDYIKRAMIAIGAVLLLGTDPFGTGAILKMTDVSLGLSVGFIVLAIVDLYVKGEPFRTVDLVFPNFWTEIVTYWPNPKVKMVRKAVVEEKPEQPPHESDQH